MTNKESLHAYLKSQNLMSLATYGEAPANCAVYFAVDDDFNMYFISEPDSEHCINIAKDPHVACAITDSHQVVSAKKIGAQIKGIVEDVNGLEQFDAIINLWNSTNPGMEAIISINNFRNKIFKSHAYKICPTTIKFFNEELYGEEGFELFPFE